MKLQGTRTLVVGMRKSGIAAAKLLMREGAHVRATDLKPLDELPEAQAFGIPFDLQTDAVFEHCELIVLSPDVPADLPAVQAARDRGVPIIGEVELAAPFMKGRTIGITGSNGKTTTTSLIGHILREAGVPSQVGGNIGVPLAAMIETSREDGWNVLELSSFQLETIHTFRAHIAIALNVTQNHLDRHHTFEQYTAAKARIFENQRTEDHAILNARDPVCVCFAQLTPAKIDWFSSRDDDQLLLDGELLMTAGDVPIRGRHNRENVLAAAIACARAGVSRQAIASAVRTFKAVEHRLEFVRNLDGIDFYNDSKATSVDATLKAIDAFPGGLWVILGGKDKGLDYSALREPLAAKAHAALLIGSAASKIADALAGAVPLVESKTLDAAIEYGFQHGAPGDTVLLAPACASFDQFRSYEHRGQVFKETVGQLKAKH